MVPLMGAPLRGPLTSHVSCDSPALYENKHTRKEISGVSFFFFYVHRSLMIHEGGAPKWGPQGPHFWGPQL